MYTSAVVRFKGQEVFMGVLEKEVYQYVRSGSRKGTRLKDMCEAFEKTPQHIGTIMRKLIAHGVIVKVSRGMYKGA